jgi:hypothetical protein
MDDTVPLADVLYVLTSKGVSVSAVDEYSHHYILAKDGWIEDRTFTNPVGKHEVMYLAHKFKIWPHLFWRTEMVNIKPEDQVQ